MTAYQDALLYAKSDNPYPLLAGHADFAIPYMAKLAEHTIEPRLNPEYFVNAIRKLANDWTFINEYLRTIRALRMDRSMHPEWYS